MPHGGRNALWQIVGEQCVPDEKQNHSPKPCEQVDLAGGYAVLKDIVGNTQFLLIPTARISGIESPAVLAPNAPNYWEDAWQARRYVEERAHHPLPRDAIGLAINSISRRSRRTSCTSMSTACGSTSSRLCASTRRPSARSGRKFPVPLAGHDYMAMRLEQPDLGRINPFDLLADGIPGARADMGHYTLVVVGAPRPASCCSPDMPRRPPATGAAASNCRIMHAPQRLSRRADTRRPSCSLASTCRSAAPPPRARSFARIAQEGEAMGYDYLTLTDHVVLPDVSVPGYPYSESGEFMSNTPTERHELLTATAFIAAKTSRIRLVLAVLVVPHRPAVLAAKMLSTIDVLSEGRLVIGIGAGWLKAEFDAVVTTPFAERGAVTDEYLEAFRALWTRGTCAVRRPLHEVRRSDLPAASGAAAASADLGRRRERAIAAPRRAVRRCVVSDRLQQQGICWTRCHASPPASRACAS